MTKPHQKQLSDDGFVLITALLILLVLTLMGLAMNRNTTTEIQIAANDRLRKQAFFEADGGTEFAAEILEQNIACLLFGQNGGGSQWLTNPADGDLVLDGVIAIENGSENFWQNVMGTYSSLPQSPAYPSDVLRDMWFPPVYIAGQSHTNITVEGASDITEGSSIIQGGGYLALGRTMSSGGVYLDYDIDAQYVGPDNSQGIVRVEYRHVVGKEDPFCKYD